MNALTVTVLGVLLISASGPACADSLELGEAAASKTNESSSLVITPTSFADDFLAPMQVGRDVWRALITKAAAANGLPPDFLMRLVAQESGFDPSSISKAGALGIAQFMPGTATLLGLRDPFDPFEAIPAAAKHLRDLRSRFGNLGLAAAAYNAGADRVTAWLAGRGNLPLETVNYLRAVTGRDASEWAPTGLPSASASIELLLQPSRTPAAGRKMNVRKQAMASSMSLCQAINSASSPCIVQQRY
jgi:hypothetical protein